VNVVVDEAWNGEAAVEVDDACALRGLTVDRDDTIAGDGGVLSEPVARPDLAVDEKERGAQLSSSLICCAR
jgi:hypothetical protein